MTLSEALRELAPVPDDVSADLRARREAACEVVLSVLQRRARGVLGPHPDADDAVAVVLMRLIQAGPRRQREELASDAQAEAYLVTALRNYRLDTFRRSHRLTDVDPGDPVNEALMTAHARPGLQPPSIGALEALIDAERWHLIDRATSMLYEELLPALAAATRDPARFTQTVLDVRDLARDTTSLEAILSRDGLPPGTTSENRLYQQHRRARGAFLERLRVRLREHPLASDLDAVVRRLAEYDMASRVTRGGQTA